VKVLTEGGIRPSFSSGWMVAGRGDNIDIAMFYVSDRGVIQSLLAASRRGVNVRLMLDPNKDAFGHAKERNSKPTGRESVGRGQRRRHPRAVVPDPR